MAKEKNKTTTKKSQKTQAAAPSKQKTTKEKTTKQQSGASASSSPSKLYRPNKGRMLAGVSAGLGEYFDLDPTIFRLIFVLLTFVAGGGVAIYLILWLIIPSEDNLQASPEDAVKQGAKEIKIKAQDVAEDMRSSSRGNSRATWGLILIGLGLLLTLDNIGIIKGLNLLNFWPLVLVILGISLINKE